jgi:molybdopterin converting factor subunit 1
MLYFAAIRDLVGLNEESIELPDEIARVADLPSFLERTKPALSGRLHGVRIAVNETFANGEEPLRDGDVVALIPPVAGG